MKFRNRVFAIAGAAAMMLCVIPAAAMGNKEPKLPVTAADEPAQPDAGAKPVEAAKPVPKKIASGNPLSGNAEAIDVGTRVYFTWCVQCHGQKANGESRFGKYAGDLTKFWRGYKEFIKIVQNGRVDKMMPPWKEYMDEETISKIGAFLETLAEEGANWQ